MQQPQVWLVEDEQGIADTLIYTLQLEGFTVELFARGLPALEKARQQRPDAVILDVGLPDISGFELCRQLLERHPALPILFLTARSDEVDRLLGLEIGADDYVAKPFSPREVSARVRTLLRRVKKFAAPSPVVRTGHFDLNEPAAQIAWFGTPLSLTRYEFLLLKTLLLSPERVYSCQQLMDIVWSDAQETFDRTVDTHIKTLLRQARLENRQDIPLAPVAVDELFTQLSEARSIQLAAKKITLTLRPSSLVVVADAELLAQALGNVLDNAIDFTPENGVITLSAQPMGEKAILQVTDSGCGIPDFALPRIFDRFYSLPRENGRKSSGLGLAFVSEAARLLNGEVTLCNRPEGGVLASLTLHRHFT